MYRYVYIYIYYACIYIYMIIYEYNVYIYICYDYIVMPKKSPSVVGRYTNTVEHMGISMSFNFHGFSLSEGLL